MAINDAAGCLHRSKTWSMDREQTRSYWLTDKGKELVEAVLLEAAEQIENRLVDKKGKRWAGGKLAY